uniref:Death domain-containing protein n=1 Tax=Amphimedon queenslandica TaxID=400682 RepID=A0A1X7UKX3_AMPQE
MIDDQPSRQLFVKYLKQLVDWKPFALYLPGITQSDVNIIDKTKKNAKAAIHQIWLQVNPTASWRDVINALKQCKENELAKTIEHQMILESTEGTESMEVIDLTDEATSVHAISVNLCNVTDALYAKGLIPQQTKGDMHVLGLAENKKASYLVHVLEEQLEVSVSDPEQYLIDVCHVLINQQQHTLTDIATSILRQL